MISNEDRALRTLIKLGGCATSQEIAEALGLGGRKPYIRAGHLMRDHVKAGRVERIGGNRAGVYRVKGMLQSNVK
jgi:hypothetical protein